MKSEFVWMKPNYNYEDIIQHNICEILHSMWKRGVTMVTVRDRLFPLL